MRRLILPWFFLITNRHVAYTVSYCSSSSSSLTSLGISLAEEDLQDEDRLARLLVQDAAPTTNKRIISSNSFSTMVSEENVDEVVGRDSTLKNDIQMIGEEEVNNSLTNNFPITSSRRSNEQLAKYTNIRCVMHTRSSKEGGTPVKEAALEWMCNSCHTYNFIGRKTCRRCKQKDIESFKHNFPPARHIPLFPTIWTCHMCGYTNNSEHCNTTSRNKFFCGNCNERFTGIREWYCPSCHHINSRGSTQCSTCYNTRPYKWTCSSCKHDGNSIFNTECRNCRTSRRKLVSDSTILCPTCRQRNDVQWEMCFLCMTPLGMMTSIKKFQFKPSNDRTVQVEKENSNKILNSDKTENQLDTLQDKEKLEKDKKDLSKLQQQQQQQQQEEAEEKEKLQKSQSKEGNKEDEEQQEQDSNVISNKYLKEKNNISYNNNNNNNNNIPNTMENGTWWCAECQVFQRRNATFCDICLKPKFSAENNKKLKNENINSENNWICDSCNFSNKDSSSLQCEKCQKPWSTKLEINSSDLKLQEKLLPNLIHENINNNNNNSVITESSIPTGQWRCLYCRKIKDITTTSCCGVSREIPFGYWLCTTCCSINRDERAQCIGCEAIPPEKPWQCFICRFRNGADDLFCHHCGSQHPHHWKCEACGVKCQQASHQNNCMNCGKIKTNITPIICQHCCAPNNPCRKACFRCRTRLFSEKWKCEKCNSTENEKNDRRCKACGEPRVFNMNEITWICDICNTTVATGGELPKRTQCPRCTADRTERSVYFPTRWSCKSCGIGNSFNIPNCLDCGGKRVLEKLHTYISCSSCFRVTLLNEKEVCEHCGGSLSQFITEAGSFVSQSGISSLIVKESSEANNIIPKSTINDISFPSFINNNSNNLSVKQQSEEEEKEEEQQKQENAKEVHLNNNNKNSENIISQDNDNDIEEEEDDDDGEEEELGEYDTDWSVNIPSWMCVNCENTNLEEEEVCANCGLRRGDE